AAVIKGRAAAAALKPPPQGKRVPRNPSLSANAAREAGDHGCHTAPELARKSGEAAVIKGRAAAAALKPPPQGKRVPRNPSLSANAAREAGDHGCHIAPEFARKSGEAAAIKGRAAAAALKPPPQGKRVSGNAERTDRWAGTHDACRTLAASPSEHFLCMPMNRSSFRTGNCWPPLLLAQIGRAHV